MFRHEGDTWPISADESTKCSDDGHCIVVFQHQAAYGLAALSCLARAPKFARTIIAHVHQRKGRPSKRISKYDQGKPICDYANPVIAFDFNLNSQTEEPATAVLVVNALQREPGPNTGS